MADVGGLSLEIQYDGNSILAVNIKSARPQAFQLLKGKTPENVMLLVPALYSLCGKAQSAATAAVMAVARHRKLANHAELERMVACEAMQEHCWRLLLDWPKQLGLAQLQQDFIRWHGMLRKIATGQAYMAIFKRELESGWLGMPSADWLKMENWDDFQQWRATSNSPAAGLFLSLDQAEAEITALQAMKPIQVPLLPNWTATEAFSSCTGKLNADFASFPTWNGVAAETGALAYHATVPLLRSTLQQKPSRVFARLLARVYDMLQMLNNDLTGCIDYTVLEAGPREAGAGLAIIKTARGTLIHHASTVAAPDCLVQDYLVVAPTEWNFHPAGALVSGLLGLQGNEAQLVRAAERQVLSLDPCVGYEIRVSHA